MGYRSPTPSISKWLMYMPSGGDWLGYNKVPDITEPSRLVVATIAKLHKEVGLDGSLINLRGFSMGGCGTWERLIRFHNQFAAAFPIAGPPGDRKALAPVIKHIPVWVFHGD